MQLIIYLILAHVLTDYLFQTENMVRNKADNWSTIFFHSGTFGISALILTIPILCWHVGISILGLTVLHIILDKTKIVLQNIYKKKDKKVTFELEIGDQAVHLAAIVIISLFIDMEVLSFIPISFKNYYLSREASMAALYVASFIFIGKGGTVLVRGLLEKTGFVPNNVQQNNKSKITEEEYNVGRLIGTLERIIILGLALLGQYTAIGFIIAAKSIGRFKDLETREFAEYYIVGTLSSIIIALAVAFLIIKIGEAI